MNDGSAGWNNPEPGKITLVSIQESYWMLEGTEFLSAMLTGLEYYPRPVRCLVFEDEFALNLFLGKAPMALELWGINPEIVDRLRRDKDLLEIPFAEIKSAGGSEG